jgi:hypothetical protein
MYSLNERRADYSFLKEEIIKKLSTCKIRELQLTCVGITKLGDSLVEQWKHRKKLLALGSKYMVPTAT